MTQDVDNYIHVVFQFTVRKDPLTIQNFEKVVKEHRLRKYVGNDLLLKRQMRRVPRKDVRILCNMDARHFISWNVQGMGG